MIRTRDEPRSRPFAVTPRRTASQGHGSINHVTVVKPPRQLAAFQQHEYARGRYSCLQVSLGHLRLCIFTDPATEFEPRQGGSIRALRGH